MLISIFVISLTSESKAWGVNNNLDFDANFSNFAVAQNIIINSDALYLKNSVLGYANNIMTKKLTIFDPGYSPQQNPETQASFGSAIFGPITLIQESEGSFIAVIDMQSISNFSTDQIRTQTFSTLSNYNHCKFKTDMAYSPYLIRIIDNKTIRATFKPTHYN